MPRNKRKRAISKTPEPNNKENETSANECVANHKGEWDTPTRSRVKTLFKVGWTRNAIEKATKVPARSQRKIQSSSDRRPGKKRIGAPKNSAKETSERLSDISLNRSKHGNLPGSSSLTTTAMAVTLTRLSMH
jgi:hypothetical protein